MLEHLHQIIIAIGASLVAILGIFAHRSGAAPVTGANPSLKPVSDQTKAEHVDDGLTARGCMELVGHEAIVCEAYKDSLGIWTWGIGVTDGSGHKVARYIDNPQPISKVLEIFIWLVRSKYLVDVRKAFGSRQLTEAQLAAALSFHYNTGAIGKALWVKQWLNGHVDEARASFMTWRSPPSIIERREKERDLFFDGKWSSDGFAVVLPVRKPSYQPDFKHSHRVDIRPDLQQLL